ncbi:MAG: hypothetical protein ACE5D1_06600, partial [Fidelibacterota bacterium]
SDQTIQSAVRVSAKRAEVMSLSRSIYVDAELFPVAKGDIIDDITSNVKKSLFPTVRTFAPRTH